MPNTQRQVTNTTETSPGPTKMRSAIFPILFLVALGLVVLGGIFGLSSQQSKADASLRILTLNVALIAVLFAYILWRVWHVIFAKRSGETAPQLHRRFVIIFSLSALVPAIFIGIFSYSLIQKNINDVFGDSVRTTMENSMKQADDFVNYRVEQLMAEIDSLELDLTRYRGRFENRISFTEYLLNQAVYRNLAALYLIDSNGTVLAKAESNVAPAYAVPGRTAMEAAKEGRTAVTNRNAENLLIGLKALEAYDGAILYAAEYLENGLLNNIDRIQSIEASMARFEVDRKRLETVFILTFFEAAFMILIAAIALGLAMANRIVRPLGTIVNAAEKVREGDLSARINLPGVWDEISDLASAFNRMTRQLHTQCEDLVREHDISEDRRSFSEAVLSGVSAGVIGLAPEGKVTLMNASAETLLNISSKDIIGLPIGDVFPEFISSLKAARESVYRTASDQITIETANETRNLDLRISAYQGERADTGWVMTFDDMTRLVAAQRHSAWREVARRIAHEIKNPLTPIQLSAERLQRKYGKDEKANPEVFDNCTATILRQVSTLERMVDEFSSFARMPAPEFQPLSLLAILKATLFAQGVAFPEIGFGFTETIDNDDIIIADERLISQALTNIYKNAGEAVTRWFDNDGGDDNSGLIETRVSNEGGTLIVEILDNGPGWPKSNKDRLLEPYVTTRDTGTGLGLAIVKRIVEDHHGTLTLMDRPDEQRGARIIIKLNHSRQTEIPASEGQQRKQYEL